MARLSVCIKSVASLLVIVAVLALPQPSQAQSLHAVLEERIETFSLQQPMSLKDAFNMLCDIVSHKRNGFELPILIDAETFKADDPAVPSIYDARVMFPPFPSKMTVAAAIRMMLSNVPTKNATYVVYPDHILVTTEKMASPWGRLQEKVRGVFDNRTVSSIVDALSDMAGATIVIDKRAADKAKTVISAKFLNDIELAGALRVVTEMAELKVIVLDGAIFVTTPGHAEALRKEYFDNIKLLSPPKGSPGPEVGAGTSLFPAAGTLGTFPAPEASTVPFDPFWPYTPQINRRPPYAPA